MGILSLDELHNYVYEPDTLNFETTKKKELNVKFNLFLQYYYAISKINEFEKIIFLTSNAY